MRLARIASMARAKAPTSMGATAGMAAEKSPRPMRSARSRSATTGLASQRPYSTPMTPAMAATISAVVARIQSKLRDRGQWLGTAQARVEQSHDFAGLRCNQQTRGINLAVLEHCGGGTATIGQGLRVQRREFLLRGGMIGGEIHHLEFGAHLTAQARQQGRCGQP